MGMSKYLIAHCATWFNISWWFVLTVKPWINYNAYPAVGTIVYELKNHTNLKKSWWSYFFFWVIQLWLFLIPRLPVHIFCSTCDLFVISVECLTSSHHKNLLRAMPVRAFFAQSWVSDRLGAFMQRSVLTPRTRRHDYHINADSEVVSAYTFDISESVKLITWLCFSHRICWSNVATQLSNVCVSACVHLHIYMRALFPASRFEQRLKQ